MAINLKPEQLEILIDQSGQIIYELSLATREVAWAGAIVQITGFSPGTVEKWRLEQWLDRVHPGDRPAVEAAVGEAQSQCKSYCLEYRFKQHNGAYVWLEDSGTFCSDDPQRMMGALREVSKRKAFETELLLYRHKLEEMVALRTAELQQANLRLSREIEERARSDAALKAGDELYRRVFECTGTAMVLVDPDLTIAMANAKASMLLGVALNEIGGRVKITEFAAPAYKDRIELYLELHMRGDAAVPSQFEFQMIDRNDTLRDIMAQLEWIPQARKVVASFMDLTQTKRAERDRERLAAVIEQSADSILLTDMHGRIEYANRSFETLHGVDPQTIVGLTVEAPLFSPQQYQILKQMTTMVRKEDTWSGRVNVQNRRGVILIADTTIFPICDARGNVINLVCVEKDVTREVQLEKQLQHSQKMEAIGTLAGGIAHDFNNILGGIFGFTELSLHIAPKNNQRLQRNLKRILEGCERARDLIQHILTFSRKNDDQSKPIEMQLVVKETLKLMRGSLPSTIQIRQRIHSRPSVVYASPTQIHQVVMNLCTNAAQAMEENGGRLEVLLENLDLSAQDCKNRLNLSPGPYVRLTVRDTGKGMDSQTQKRIFEPYFTTKPPGGGTGLGLAVVHGIVQKLEGIVQVDSRLNKGTTFDVYLPRLPDQAITQPPAMSDPPRGTEHVLVVDDEIFILEILRELLETLGYSVETAGSGQQALEKLQANPERCDLVITDQFMPKMTGSQLSEQIQALRPGLPVVLCTGMNLDLQKTDTLPPLFHAVILKPIQYDQLALIVRQVLDTDPMRTNLS